MTIGTNLLSILGSERFEESTVEIYTVFGVGKMGGAGTNGVL